MTNEETTRLVQSPYFETLRKYEKELPEPGRAIPIEGLLWNATESFQQDLLNFVDGAKVHVARESADDLIKLLSSEEGVKRFMSEISYDVKRKNDRTKDYSEIVIAIVNDRETTGKLTRHGVRWIAVAEKKMEDKTE